MSNIRLCLFKGMMNLETLRIGSTGGNVSKLQSLLNNRGYGLLVDGIFGSVTDGAVRRYQSSVGLYADGIVGPKTWGSLGLGGSPEGYDITELVSEIRWKGRKGAAARSLEAVILDDGMNNRDRSGIDIEEGNQCIFYEDDEELFRGIIMSQDYSDSREMRFTAYDNGIYLSNNDDTFTYTNCTADAIFKDVCTRFGIPMGTVAKCGYIIPELVKSKTSAWDTIADALSMDFDATKIRHYVSSDKGEVSLLQRNENILQWVMEVNVNIASYTYKKSIENIKTRVKFVSSEDTVIATRINEDLESKIGIFQEVEKPDEDLTDAQINALIDSMLEEKSTPERSLSLNVLGQKEVISGVGVYVIIPELGLERTFYVDQDVHTYKGNAHTMSITLNYANDIGLEATQGVPQTVQFGDINETVSYLQTILNQKDGAGLLVDGWFGAITLGAVERYQYRRGLVVDGIVGPITWKDLLS